jgi:membrane-associated protein
MTEPAIATAEDPGRAQQAICGAGLLVGIVASYVLIAITPELLAHHDLILEATGASIVSIVTGGALASQGREPLVLVVLAPLTSVVLYDVFFWWAGKLWGRPFVARFVAQTPRWDRRTARAEDLVRRHGVWALLAGYFLALFLRVAALVGLGYAIGEPAVRLAMTISRYGLRVTIGLVVVIVVVAAVKQSRARPPETPPSQTDA